MATSLASRDGTQARMKARVSFKIPVSQFEVKDDNKQTSDTGTLPARLSSSTGDVNKPFRLPVASSDNAQSQDDELFQQVTQTPKGNRNMAAMMQSTVKKRESKINSLTLISSMKLKANRARTAAASSRINFINFLSSDPKMRKRTSATAFLPKLKTYKFFKRFPERQRIDLLMLTSHTHVDGNTAVFEQGDLGDTFYIVLHGFCDVLVQQGDKGRERVATVQPGEGFGELALHDENSKRNATVIASSGGADLMCVSKQDYEAVVKKWASADKLQCVDFVQSHPAFSALDETEQRQVAYSCEIVSLEKGENVYSVGELPKGLFFVLTGSLEQRYPVRMVDASNAETADARREMYSKNASADSFSLTTTLMQRHASLRPSTAPVRRTTDGFLVSPFGQAAAWSPINVTQSSHIKSPSKKGRYNDEKSPNAATAAAAQSQTRRPSGGDHNQFSGGAVDRPFSEAMLQLPPKHSLQTHPSHPSPRNARDSNDAPVQNTAPRGSRTARRVLKTAHSREMVRQPSRPVTAPTSYSHDKYGPMNSTSTQEKAPKCNSGERRQSPRVAFATSSDAPKHRANPFSATNPMSLRRQDSMLKVNSSSFSMHGPGSDKQDKSSSLVQSSGSSSKSIAANVFVGLESKMKAAKRLLGFARKESSDQVDVKSVETIILTQMSAGEMFGEAETIIECRRATTVTVTSTDCKAIMVPKAVFESHIMQPAVQAIKIQSICRGQWFNARLCAWFRSLLLEKGLKPARGRGLLPEIPTAYDFEDEPTLSLSLGAIADQQVTTELFAATNNMFSGTSGADRKLGSCSSGSVSARNNGAADMARSVPVDSQNWGMALRRRASRGLGQSVVQTVVTTENVGAEFLRVHDIATERKRTTFSQNLERKLNHMIDSTVPALSRPAVGLTGTIQAD